MRIIHSYIDFLYWSDDICILEWLPCTKANFVDNLTKVYFQVLSFSGYMQCLPVINRAIYNQVY